MMKKMIAVAAVLALAISACANGSGTRISDSKMQEYQELLAKENIRVVINRLFISTDDRDWNAIRQIFAPEVLFDMTSMVGGKPVTMTPVEIVAAWEKGLRPLKAIHHQVGNYVETLKENEAEVFCYGIATHYYPNPAGGSVNTFVGSYDFHLLKEGQKSNGFSSISSTEKISFY